MQTVTVRPSDGQRVVTFLAAVTLTSSFFWKSNEIITSCSYFLLAASPQENGYFYLKYLVLVFESKTCSSLV